MSSGSRASLPFWASLQLGLDRLLRREEPSVDLGRSRTPGLAEQPPHSPAQSEHVADRGVWSAQNLVGIDRKLPDSSGKLRRIEPAVATAVRALS
jgi:hypothetical protein